MIQSRALLLVGQTVEKIKERNRVGFFLPLLRSFRLTVIIAELLPLYHNRSAVRRFGKGKHIVLGEAAGLGTESGQTAASLNVGTVGILHGGRIKLMQDDDGQVTEPYSISAGLDYPGTGPMHCNLYETGRAQVMAITDKEALQAAFELTRLEGIIPALESSHALAMLPKMKFKPDDVVVLTVSGRGDKDLATYLSHKDEIDYDSI